MKINSSTTKNVPTLLLRIGLAWVFLYAAVGSFMHPAEWISYLPSFIQKLSAAHTLLKAIAGYEIILALWLLSGYLVRYAALLAAATLAGIVVSQPGALIITFRDIGLVFMALALVASN